MFRYKNYLKSQKAFTLIELMIVVSIIGILAGIAYPSYQDSVIRSRRADAKGALMSFTNAMERHFTENNSYCGAGTDDNGACLSATGLPTIFPTTSPVNSTDIYYNLTLVTATATTYNLRATAVNTQAGDGNLEINHTESRGRWDTDADGTTDGPWD